MKKMIFSAVVGLLSLNAFAAPAVNYVCKPLNQGRTVEAFEFTLKPGADYNSWVAVDPEGYPTSLTYFDSIDTVENQVIRSGAYVKVFTANEWSNEGGNVYLAVQGGLHATSRDLRVKLLVNDDGVLNVLNYLCRR